MTHKKAPENDIQQYAAKNVHVSVCNLDGNQMRIPWFDVGRGPYTERTRIIRAIDWKDGRQKIVYWPRWGEKIVKIPRWEMNKYAQ